MRGAELTERFDRLDQLLTEQRKYWQFQSFHHSTAPWHDQRGLTHALAALSEAESAELDDNPGRRASYLEPWLPAARTALQLSQLERIQGPALSPHTRLSYGVPGRKWQQLLQFAPLVPADQAVVEWCAGKGHLGRLLAASGTRSVLSLEYDATLCQGGQKLAERAGVDIQYRISDVTQAKVARFLDLDTHAVALHACGDLHLALLHHAVERNIRGLTLAPCCYHLTKQTCYVPLSVQARSSQLRLSRADLGFAVKETATAGARLQRRSRTEVCWRLSFDSLQRSLRGVDEYLPLPSIPGKLLNGSFTDFVQWAAARKDLSLPEHWDSAHFAHLGEQRYLAVRRMECVRRVFQRPLELWLVLDRALYLQQHGYQVRVGEFCERETTPRNIVLCASQGPDGQS